MYRFFATLALTAALCGAAQAQVAQQKSAEFKRAEVYFPGLAAGKIIIRTKFHYLYLGVGDGKAIRYGIGVGREGMTWKGLVRVGSKKEWPDWTPPKEMLQRRPDLPRFMQGGAENPLGARALYLFNGEKDTLYRIHGTNEPNTIGRNVSSGCIRLTNFDVIDLYKRVELGAEVTVE